MSEEMMNETVVENKEVREVVGNIQKLFNFYSEYPAVVGSEAGNWSNCLVGLAHIGNTLVSKNGLLENNKGLPEGFKELEDEQLKTNIAKIFEYFNNYVVLGKFTGGWSEALKVLESVKVYTEK